MAVTPRGAGLWLLAVIWLNTGYTVATTADSSPGVKLPLEYLPEWLRIDLWVVPALVALAVSLTPRWTVAGHADLTRLSLTWVAITGLVLLMSAHLRDG